MAGCAVLSALSVRLTCTNGSLPESLKLGDISQPTSSSPDRMQFRNIRTVSPALNPPTGEALLWRMVSHVSLNFLSVANAENLQALLSLYVFPERHEQGQEPGQGRARVQGREPGQRVPGPGREPVPEDRSAWGRAVLAGCGER